MTIPPKLFVFLFDEMCGRGRRAAWLLLVLLSAAMEQDAGAIEEVPFESLDPAQRNQVGLGRGCLRQESLPALFMIVAVRAATIRPRGQV